MGEELVRRIFADVEGAPIDDKLRKTLRFVEKLTLTPEAVTADDVQVLRDAGVSDEQIEDAIHVCAGFSCITRVADALEFRLQDEAGYAASAKNLLSRGYVL